MITQEMIDQAYQTLSQRREELFDALEEETVAKLEYLDENNKTTLSGEIDGKNKEQRDAQMWDALIVQRQNLAEKEAAARQNRMDFDLAEMNVKRISMTIRALELDKITV